MAHSFVQSYDDEISAFRDFAEAHPDNCVLLVDTYDTLKSGLPNAIKIGKEMKDRGEKLKGIRLNSGDLAYLAKQGRKMLDDAGLEDVKIAASNQLDEHVRLSTACTNWLLRTESHALNYLKRWKKLPCPTKNRFTE